MTQDPLFDLPDDHGLLFLPALPVHVERRFAAVCRCRSWECERMASVDDVVVAFSGHLAAHPRRSIR